MKAAREAGFDGSFYTFYGNALGAPAAIGDAGIGRVCGGGRLACRTCGRRRVRGLLPRLPHALPEASDDYVHMRMQLMVEALAQAIEKAGSVDTRRRGARPREGLTDPRALAGHEGTCAPPTTSSTSRCWSA